MRRYPFTPIRMRRIILAGELRKRFDYFERGQHWLGGGFYPAMHASQRWFKGEGRYRRDPENRLLRYGGRIVSF